MDASPGNLPSSMRAWTHKAAGRPETVLRLTSDLALPKIQDTGRVLVRVQYAALNPGGSIMMQLLPALFRTKPCIPELDFAGTIVQLGDQYPISGKLRPGMKIFGSVPVTDHVGRGSGTLADCVAVEADYVLPIPAGMKLEEASGLGVAGCTALKLLDAVQVKEGMRILVNAAGGGIGSLVLQMVREAVGKTGYVVAVCSAEKKELVHQLGANEVCLQA
jgi:reticulon-4-interacting protein 1, mitochondrial